MACAKIQVVAVVPEEWFQVESDGIGTVGITQACLSGDMPLMGILVMLRHAAPALPIFVQVCGQVTSSHAISVISP